MGIRPVKKSGLVREDNETDRDREADIERDIRDVVTTSSRYGKSVALRMIEAICAE